MTWTHCLPNLQILKNADISELDEQNESDDEEEDLYYPPDSDGNIFDTFDNDEALQ